MFQRKYVLCQAAQVRSSAAAVADAAGARPADAKTPEELRTGKAITAQGLDQFFDDVVEAAKPGQQESTYIAVVVSSLLSMDTASVGTLLKEFAAKERHEKLATERQWDKAKMESVWTTHRNRAKEMRQVYGAAKHRGMKAETMGWSRAYETARKLLKEATDTAPNGILWDGSPAPTDLDRERNATKREGRKIAQEVKDAVQDYVNETGDKATPTMFAAAAEQIEQQLAGRQYSIKAIRLVLELGADAALVVANLIPQYAAIQSQDPTGALLSAEVDRINGGKFVFRKQQAKAQDTAVDLPAAEVRAANQ